MSDDDPEVLEALHRLTRIMTHVHGNEDMLKVGMWGLGDASKNLFGVDVNPEKYDFPADTPEETYVMGGVNVGSVKAEIAKLISENSTIVEERDKANATKKNCNEKITANNKTLREKINWIKSAIDWKKKQATK